MAPTRGEGPAGEPGTSSKRSRRPKSKGSTEVRGVFFFPTVSDADRAADLLADQGVRFDYEVFVRPVDGSSKAWRVAR